MNLPEMARAAANEAIIDIWGEEIEMVEAWLQETHPELIDDSGQTCWGVLVSRLYEIKAQNAELSDAGKEPSK